MEIYKKILSEIINIRKISKLNRLELSRELDKDDSYWYKVESEDIILSIEMLFKVLKIFEVNPIDFFIKVLNYENGLFAKVDSLSEKDKIKLNDFIEKFLK